MLALGFATPHSAFAEGAISKWDGKTVATTYAGGTGAEDDPYQIATADQFKYFANQISAGEGVNAHYVLTSDVDMTAANWEPIGGTDLTAAVNSGTYFQGVFDGGGHNVSYKYEADTFVSAYGVIGLFGFSQGEIRNTNVDGSIELNAGCAYSFFGGVCGFLAGDITGCGSDVDITTSVNSVINAGKFGGVVGNLEFGTLKQCSYTGEIKVLNEASNMTNGYFGGIAGICTNMLLGVENRPKACIDQCKNGGSIVVSVQSSAGTLNLAVGGIVGGAMNPVEAEGVRITDCYNTGSVAGNYYTGGIAGTAAAKTANTSTVISNCFSLGRSSGTYAQAIVGKVNSESGLDGTVSVSSCYYTEGSDTNSGVESVTKEQLKDKLIEESEEGKWIIDANGDIRLSWELKRLDAPTASFSAADDNSGTLSGLSTGMEYRVGDGEWVKVVASDSVVLTDLIAGASIQIKAIGDGVNTLDSDIQTITVTQAAAPTPKAQGCTNSSQNDGKITGVSNAMEYRAANVENWESIKGDTISNLAPGKYLVRVKASGTKLASPTVEVAVASYSSGGGSYVPPTYKVEFPTDVEHGKVTVKPTRAEAGDKVTVTVVPDDLYELDTFEVRGRKGDLLGTVDNGDGTYTFTMPRGSVSVAVTFREIPAPVFSDVDPNAWYADAVSFVARKGLIKGYGDSDLFGVGYRLTRGELATILWRYAADSSEDFDTSAAVNKTGMPDVADGAFYTEAANWAVENGVINGYVMADGSRTFGPNDPVTLEQMVAIIGNLTAEGDAVSKADVSVLDRYADKAGISSWATKSVAWATEVGLVNGYDLGSTKEIRSTECIARERAAASIFNAFKIGLME